METILGLRVTSELGSGAEARLCVVDFFGTPAVLKLRRPKSYRHPDLDKNIRETRTLLEARLLSRACLAGVYVPLLFAVSKSSCALLMEYVKGESLLSCTPREFVCQTEVVGRCLAKMHTSSIIHGDPTPSNILLKQNRMFIVDFGLGIFSASVEDRAVDVNLYIKVSEAIHPSFASDIRQSFFTGYAAILGTDAARRVEVRMDEIRLRGRYVTQRREKFEKASSHNK